MNPLLLLLGCLLALQGCYAPPVTQNKQQEADSDEKNLEDYMEYHRYLKEVVNALESDADFRKKLEKAEEADIKSGKIAEELEFVSHHVRTKLDEIKRVELQRLKELMEQKKKLLDTNSIDADDPMHHHLDHSNPHTFEVEDLKKLIAKTTSDLAEADRKRREEFKQYEMQKEFEKQDKLNHTVGEEHEKLEKEYKEKEEKHKKHEKLHEPGHKAQLEEVWEEQDQMQQDFDPKTFFMLHDLDGNGLWDQDEVKALFIKELEKMYEQGHPEDDMREKAEEMERMRESVFREIDKNRDMFIDYEEFLAQTKSNEFNQDNGWQGLDEQKPYTDEELQEYIRQHQLNQIPQGYQGYPPQGYPNPNFHPAVGYQAAPPAGYAQPPPYHPNAVPQAGEFHPGQIPHQPPQQLPPHVVQQQAYQQQQHYQQQQAYQQQQQQQQQYQQQQQQYQQAPPQQQRQPPPPPQQYQQQPPPQQNQQTQPQQNQQIPSQQNQQVNQVQPQGNAPPPAVQVQQGYQQQQAPQQQQQQQQQQGYQQPVQNQQGGHHPQAQAQQVNQQQANVQPAQNQNVPQQGGAPPQVNRV